MSVKATLSTFDWAGGNQVKGDHTCRYEE